MLPKPLQDTAFRRFWTARTISLFGDQVTLVVLPLIGALALHASPAEMGYLTAAGLLPSLLLSLHAGAWIDRRGKRRQMMILADVARAALLLTIPAAAVWGVLTLLQLYIVAFAVGTFSVLFEVSRSTVFVSLVPRDQYVAANSLLNGSRPISYMAGTSLGGLLVEILTAPIALLVDAFSYLASAYFLTRIKPVEPPTEVVARSRVMAGIRYIAQNPVVRAALGATATVNFFMFMIAALMILYATTTLDVPPGALGLTMAAGAIGGLAGAVLTGRVTRRIGVGPAFIVGCVAFPAPLLLVPAAGGPLWLVIAMLAAAQMGAGAGLMILDISIGSIFAAIIPHRFRARVDGAYRTVNFGIKAVGALAGGGLASVIGMRETLVVAGLGALTGVVWVARSPIPSLHELPEPSEEPESEPATATPRTDGDAS